jgi:hypothetical protein
MGWCIYTTNVSGKCQKQNKLIKFNKCQETRAMLILKFKCLNVSVANTKKVPNTNY